MDEGRVRGVKSERYVQEGLRGALEEEVMC